MSKSKKLDVRLDEVERELIREGANKCGMSVSDYMRNALKVHSIKILSSDAPTKHQHDLIRKIDLKERRRLNKESQHQRFFIANTTRRIKLQALSSYYLNRGDINMKPIKAIIQDAEKEWKLIEPKIKRELKKDWVELKKYKTFAGIESAINSFKRLDVKK